MAAVEADTAKGALPCMAAAAVRIQEMQELLSMVGTAAKMGWLAPHRGAEAAGTRLEHVAKCAFWQFLDC